MSLTATPEQAILIVVTQKDPSRSDLKVIVAKNMSGAPGGEQEVASIKGTSAIIFPPAGRQVIYRNIGIREISGPIGFQNLPLRPPNPLEPTDPTKEVSRYDATSDGIFDDLIVDMQVYVPVRDGFEFLPDVLERR